MLKPVILISSMIGIGYSLFLVNQYFAIAYGIYVTSLLLLGLVEYFEKKDAAESAIKQWEEELKAFNKEIGAKEVKKNEDDKPIQ